MKLLEGLNKPQVEAVLHTNGPLLALASPGSGKTGVLTRRIARLIQDGGSPHEILGVTFTNKAAGEMRKRIEKMLGRKAQGLWLCTFHATAVRFLRKSVEAFPFGRTRSFDILDKSAQIKEMRESIRELGLSDKDYKPATFLTAIQEPKTLGYLPEEYEFSGTNARLYQQVAPIYEKRLRQMNAFDFGDLLLYATQMFARDAKLKEYWSRTFQYLLVDEYQDTNPVQLLLLDQLTSTHKNIFVVGDENQTIFGWNYANVQTILDFAKDYENAKIIKMVQNYRSTPEIVKASNALIERNKQRTDKVSFTENAPGEPLYCVIHDTERVEALWAVNTAIMHHQLGTPWQEIAVLYRTNAQARVIEEAFVRKGIPYTVRGAFKFYDREEIQDLLAYLRVLSNPANTAAWERMANKPTRGVSAATVKELLRHAKERKINFPEAMGEAHYLLKATALKNVQRLLALYQRLTLLQNGKPSQLLQSIIEGVEFEQWIKGVGDTTNEDLDRWHNVEELVRAVVMYEEETPAEEVSLLGFLERVALVTQEEDNSRDENKVALMTCHVAKGLEYDVVMVTGVEQGLIPHANSMMSLEGCEEERRLLYVAMTRARKHLYLSRAYARWMYGKPMDCAESQFLREIRTHLT